MRSIRVLFLFLLMSAPLASAKWVRFEAEDAILPSPNAEILEISGASGGKAVFLTNAAPPGAIDYVVQVADPNTAYPMRIGFYSDGNDAQKYDDVYVNSTTTKFIDQNWACGYYWDPYPRPDNKFESYRNSIVTYGTDPQFQLLSRWWAAWDSSRRDIPMTVPLLAGTNIIRIQSAWSHTTHDFIELDLPEMPFNPSPVNGDAEVRSTQGDLSWENPAGTLANRVYFGQSDSEPNLADYKTKLTTVIDVYPGAAPSIPMPTLQDGLVYYWLVNAYDKTDMSDEPNFPGVIWSFTTRFNAAPVIEIAMPYPYLGQEGIAGQATIALDATVTDDGGVVSYLWEQVSGPATAVINSPEMEDTTITVTEEGHPYVFQLTAGDGSRSTTAAIAFEVDDTACEAARRKPNTHNIADITYDCMVDMADFQALAYDWLSCLDTVTGNDCN